MRDRACLSVLAFLLPFPSPPPDDEEREEQEGYAAVLSLLLHRLCTRAPLQPLQPLQGETDVCGLVLTCAMGYDSSDRALTMPVSRPDTLGQIDLDKGVHDKGRGM